jgi:ABC-2 type transport system ATP-binding protein
MSSNHQAVEVTGLTKRFGELVAVNDISFEVKRGELFGFLGPNGAGKTTTIRMVTGIIKKDGGEARVMGFKAGSLPAKQLSGVVPEQANAYMDLTGWQNLMLMAQLYRTPANEAKKRAAALLTQLGLYQRKDTKVMTYSMGMRKRLILAMALLSDPQILFLDEPTSGLDVQSVRFIRAMLRNLKQEGKTIFLTTHNMDEATEMCDRVAIINRGKIVALDRPDNLSITAGRVYLVDVNFDKTISPETLTKLPGVNRLESAQAIEAAEGLRAQQAMAGAGRAGGMGGPGRMPAQMAGGSPPGMARPGNTGQQPGMVVGKTAALETGAEKKTDNRFRLYTENTTLLICSLVDFSRANSLNMNILNVRPPSLEDAFIRLTEEKSHAK